MLSLLAVLVFGSILAAATVGWAVWRPSLRRRPPLEIARRPWPEGEKVEAALAEVARERRAADSRPDAPEGPVVTALTPSPVVDLPFGSHLPGMVYRCDTARRVRLASAGSIALTGHTPEELSSAGRSLDDLIHPEDLATVRTEIAKAIAGQRPYQLIYRLCPKNGDSRWVWDKGQPCRRPDGEIVLEGYLADFTERKRAQDELLEGIFQDRLTGLASRELLFERIAMALRRGRRRAHPGFAVLCLDLDRFHLVNQSLGFDRGDELLRAAGERITTCLRQEDTVARLAADGFAILLEEVQRPSDAARIAERLVRAIEAPIDLGQENVAISTSVGITTSAPSYERPEEMLRDAEIALVRAKELGGGKHRFFDHAMRLEAMAELQLEADLRRALDRQEMAVHYQPVVRLVDGRIVGFEALLRWHHPTRGLLEPGSFLAKAEEAGLVGSLGWWVLEEATRVVRRWQSRFPADPPFFLCVNVSGRQLTDPDAVDYVAATLQANRFEAQHLYLEITEDAVLDHVEEVAATLGQLRAMGVHLALDDFGTGYASLSSLSQMPLTTLKIDRSFVASIEHRAHSKAIVRSVTELAHHLGLTVIAEGIENRDQLQAVVAAGCELAQGFLLAPPLAAEAIESLLGRETPRDGTTSPLPGGGIESRPYTSVTA